MSDLEIPLRYELKYAIPDWQVAEVRGALQPYCRLDPYCADRDERSYAIQTIYFDTWERGLYRRSRERRPRSMKVRARTYDGGRGPVFLEVKAKENGLIRKTRACIAAGWAERLEHAATVDASPEERLFRDHLARFSLRPVLLVRYQREAWCGAVDGYARATFDRRIACRPWWRWDFATADTAWLPLDSRSSLATVPRGVLFELKCTLDVPAWMLALVRRLGLRRIGFSKYCNGVERVWGPEPLGQLAASFARGGDHG